MRHDDYKDTGVPVGYTGTGDNAPVILTLSSNKITKEDSPNNGKYGYFYCSLGLDNNNRDGVYGPATMTLDKVIWGSDGFTAHLMILPTDLSGITFTVGVLCKDGSRYQYTSPQIGKKYVKGMRYTAILGGNNWVKVSDKEGEVPALSIYNDATQAAAGFDSGTGTKEGPFIIADASQLKYLQEQVNTAPKPTWNNKDHYIRLDTDIKIAGNWVPIGVEGEHYFEANFDGNGHTIYGNLKDVNNTYANYGFFGYVEYESISNLHLVGNIKGTILGGKSGFNYTTYNTTGGIAGAMTVGSTSQCTPADIVLSNSTNRGTVTGGNPVATNINYIGGLVGGNSSMLHSCLNAVSATVSTGSGAAAENQTYTGGLVGYNAIGALVYSCCTNQATVNGAAATNNNQVGSVPVTFRLRSALADTHRAINR